MTPSTAGRSAGATIVGVYRNKNALAVERLLAPALEIGWRAAWWALDEAHERLRDVTVGSGVGEKLPLLNKAIQEAGAIDGYLLLSDDDIVFRRRDIVRLVEACGRARLHIAQPAHARRSRKSHRITAVQHLSRARLTTFVEGGPLVVIDPAWVERVAPLPSWRGMGWGVELDWSDLRPSGCRLGIVDMCPIVHFGRVAAEYDRRKLAHRLRAELVERGIANWAGTHETLATWRPWQHAPPWTSPSSAATR